MKHFPGLDREKRQRLMSRTQRVLDGLLEYEAILKATTYDKDKQQGHYGSQIPSGVELQHLEKGGPIVPVWISPYHHFRQLLAIETDEFAYRATLRRAEAKLDQFESPSRESNAIGGTNWEEVEVSIIEEGWGAGPAVLAEKYGVTIDVIRQIREESDHEPETGVYTGEDRYVVKKVLELHHINKFSPDRIAQIVRKSRATVYRYIKDHENDRAA